MSRKPLSPLIWGRTIRIVLGILTLLAVAVLGVEVLTIWGAGVLCFLGVSFVIGGLTANPGCEITAIPNLFRAKEKSLHCA